MCIMLYSEGCGVWVVVFALLAVLWGDKGELGCWFNPSGQKIKLVVVAGGEAGSNIWLKGERMCFTWGDSVWRIKRHRLIIADLYLERKKERVDEGGCLERLND